MTISSITESVNPATAQIDTLSTRMIVAAIHAEDAQVAAAVAAVGDAIAQLVDTAAERMRRGGRLIYIGAGTSGRLAPSSTALVNSSMNRGTPSVCATIRSSIPAGRAWPTTT